MVTSSNAFFRSERELGKCRSITQTTSIRAERAADVDELEGPTLPPWEAAPPPSPLPPVLVTMRYETMKLLSSVPLKPDFYESKAIHVAIGYKLHFCLYSTSTYHMWITAIYIKARASIFSHTVQYCVGVKSAFLNSREKVSSCPTFWFRNTKPDIVYSC